MACYPLQQKARWALIVFILVGLVGILWFNISNSRALKNLPNPNLSYAEEQVQNKIQSVMMRVRESPKSADAWGTLAMNLDVHDFKLESIPCYERAIRLEPDVFRWTYYYTIVLSETGSPAAIEWFKRALQMKPDYPPLYVLYARARYELGDLEAAEEGYRQAVALDPHNPHAYLGIGQIALAKGTLMESKAALLKTVEIQPAYREAYGLLAEVYRRQGNAEEAATVMAKSESLPKITPLYDPLYEQLVLEGVSSFWYRDRGLVYQAEGRLQEAVQEFKTALRLKPDAEGHKYVGDLLQELELFEEAVSHYRKAISISRYQLNAYAALGQLLYNLDRPEEAVTVLERSLRIEPRFPGAYLGLSNIYQARARESDALRVLSRGLHYTQSYPPIALELAWLLSTSPDEKLRNGEQAVQLAEAACSASGYQDAQALDILATAYAEAGRFEEALQTAKKARSIAKSSGNDELAEEIRSRVRSFQSHLPYHRPVASIRFN